MITKERLEELIKEKAKVYFIQNETFIAGYSSIAKIKELDLSNFKPIYFTSSNIKNDFMAIKSASLTVNRNDFENLFETKEDAEFTLRFKRIPKTEYLDLPTWEEFIQSDKQIIFYNKDKTFYIDKVMNNTHIIIGYKCILDLIEGLEANRYNLDKKPATKENYLKFCELARKLFLREKI